MPGEAEKANGGGQVAQKEAKPAGLSINSQGMLLLLALAIIAALAVYYLSQGSERELAPADFRTLLNATQQLAVVQDLRAIPAGDSTGAKRKAQDCGIQLSYTLSILGKNVTNYAFEGESCYGGSTSAARPPSECVKEMKSEGRLPFYVEYNSTANKTRLLASGAHYYGDAVFLGDCAITGIAR